jgi:hypothetical protein
MPGWVLLIVLIGHISSNGNQPMTSTTLPMATHEACDAAAADLRQHLVGSPFIGGDVADIITKCEPTSSQPHQ